jgi:hypothetical protein
LLLLLLLLLHCVRARPGVSPAAITVDNCVTVYSRIDLSLIPNSMS